MSITRSSALSVFLVGVCAHGALAQQPTLDCDIGPLTKTYGATQWLVYGCSDDKSVVFITPSDSPAAPFYFMLYPKDGKYVVVGEGTGSKAHTDRAYAELVKLSAQDAAALIAAAKAQGSQAR
jgi:hypothetical protein